MQLNGRVWATGVSGNAAAQTCSPNSSRYPSSNTHHPTRRAMLRPSNIRGLLGWRTNGELGTFNRCEERLCDRSGSCSTARQPCVMFGYGTHDEAMTARQYIV